jgi:hypothetical protein
MYKKTASVALPAFQRQLKIFNSVGMMKQLHHYIYSRDTPATGMETGKWKLKMASLNISIPLKKRR